MLVNRKSPSGSCKNTSSIIREIADQEDYQIRVTTPRVDAVRQFS